MRNDIMELAVGTTKTFTLTDATSEYVLPNLQVYFSDLMAEAYQPIIYSANQFYDPDNRCVQPEGMYYRIVYDDLKNEYCIQYYVYWLEQECTGILGISNHKYDYEPIFVYIQPSEALPIGIINSGESKVLGLNQCRFHKTEIRRKEYSVRDDVEKPYSFTTSASPYYPFGGSNGIEGRNCNKRYPIAGSIYFSGNSPMFAIASCFHAFSGAESLLKGERINILLKKLDDNTLTEWFKNHYRKQDEEPFGHDVSNPFEFPFIKYVDPKPILK